MGTCRGAPSSPPTSAPPHEMEKGLGPQPIGHMQRQWPGRAQSRWEQGIPGARTLLGSLQRLLWVPRHGGGSRVGSALASSH